MSPLIVISYARQDGEFGNTLVHDLYHILLMNNIRVWGIPEDEISGFILEEADIMIVVLSHSWLRSSGCLDGFRRWFLTSHRHIDEIATRTVVVNKEFVGEDVLVVLEGLVRLGGFTFQGLVRQYPDEFYPHNFFDPKTGDHRLLSGDEYGQSTRELAGEIRKRLRLLHDHGALTRSPEIEVPPFRPSPEGMFSSTSLVPTDAAVYCPPHVQIESTFLVQVYLYQPVEATEAAIRAHEADTQTVQRAFLTTLIDRIDVGTHQIDIHLSPTRLAAFLDGAATPLPSATEDEIKILSIPVRLRRCGRAITMLIAGTEAFATAKPDARLVKLLIRARQFNTTLLDSGGVPFAALAKREGLSPSYFTRLVRLSYLAPDIIEAILDGRQPPDLTADKLLAHSRLPLTWHEQRTVLGLA
jgi:hypothetical protein